MGGDGDGGDGDGDGDGGDGAILYIVFCQKRNHFLFTHAIGCYALHCIMVAMWMYYCCQVMSE